MLVKDERSGAGQIITITNQPHQVYAGLSTAPTSRNGQRFGMTVICPDDCLFGVERCEFRQHLHGGNLWIEAAKRG